MKGPRPRKIPQRTCISCRSVRAKRDLVRIVRTPEGEVVVDLTGKKNGRGAYLCRQRVCWETGLKRGAIERALKQAVPEENRGALAAFAANLPEKLVPPPRPGDGDNLAIPTH
jgi:predicted RNA-binding protein YlxR (DUF448 family)